MSLNLCQKVDFMYAVVHFAWTFIWSKVIAKHLCSCLTTSFSYYFLQFLHPIFFLVILSQLLNFCLPRLEKFPRVFLIIMCNICFGQSLDDLKSTAVEAVLLLQGKINDEDDGTVTLRLLVPSKVIGCIIGKSGSIINEIRKRTKADIRISKGEKPKCADANDELVEV